MANVQAQFEVFHKEIRTYYEINETLREKKDIIVRRVKKHLDKNDRPQCTEFIQGSYKMKVGICAVEGLEYDTQGRLRALSQHGWRVDYLDWFPAEGARPVLPRREEARRDGAAVKLAVDQWQMAPQ